MYAASPILNYHSMTRVIFVLLTFYSLSISAQKYDYHWVIGYSSFPNVDVVFTDTSADTLSKRRGVNMFLSQTSISDASGALQFYTNGGKIYDFQDSVMLNGDSLNYGDGMMWNNNGGGAYTAVEEVVRLPTESSGIWNLMHYYVELQNNSYPYAFSWLIYQTRIDMNRNSGRGEVIFKNKTIVQDTLGGYITACRHANGRDWWVLCSQASSNCFYELLVQPDTILEYGLQCMGSNYINGDGGQAAFSPDGTKFGWLDGPVGVNLFDFDRCTGTLSNPLHFPLYRNVDSDVIEYGLAFSPNSRYMYISQSTYIFQLDLQAADIWASLDTVGFYHAPPDSTTSPSSYFLLQLGPDGKIYVCGANTMHWLHVINDPDKKGDSCNFINYGLRLPYNNGLGLPSYPNYRLGPLAGSPCDTLSITTAVTAATKEKILKIFPNPASDYTIIDYGFTDWSKGEITLQISSEQGQKIYSQKLPMYSGYQKIDVSQFAPGLYNLAIVRNTGVVAIDKFVKMP
ncbi:MAG: hypothetical protein JWO06_445 [Bacteroidota bacterium]|nr:hypothetical protein [Bacteroidota bacterium]